MNTDLLLYVSNGIVALFLIMLFIFSIQVVRGRITWGQARVMGITFSLFIWIEVVFFLVLFESAFGIVSYVINLPFWVDLIVAFTTIAIITIIYIKLSSRNTFKPALFVSLVLVPLGIPGVHIIGKLAKAGAIEIVEKSGIYFVKSNESPVINNTAEGLVISKWPQTVKSSIGDIIFINSHHKGRFGDRLTAIRLTAIGYKKLKSKYSSLHGLDGIYIKKSKRGDIEEIIIAENKVDKGSLSMGPPKQMSDEWIKNKCEQMLKSVDVDIQRTAELILKYMKETPYIIKKQLWKHDLEKEATIVREIGINGEVGSTVYKWTDKRIKNELTGWCNKGKLECEKVVYEIGST